MKLRMNHALNLGLCLLLACAAGFLWRRSGFWPLSHLSADPQPCLLCPARFEFDACELGETKICSYNITNTGNAPLQIKAVRKTCACIGIEIREGSDFISPALIQVPPGQAVEARTRIITTGHVGGSLSHRLLLETNDPQQPEVALEFHIKHILGGLNTFPAEVDFGVAGIGDVKTLQVQLFDSSKKKRTITGVSASNPLCAVKFIPDPANESSPHGQCLGQLEITASLNLAGSFNEKILIQLSDDQVYPMEIPVRAMVRDHGAFYPSHVILPRASSHGPSYQTKVMFRSLREQLASMQVLEYPPFCEVTVHQEADDLQARIEIRAMPDRLPDQPEAKGLIVLEGTLASGMKIKREVTLTCRKPAEPNPEPASPSRK